MKTHRKAIQSLKERGLRRTMEIVICKLEGFWFDLRFGTDTMRCVELATLEIESENKQRGSYYEAVGTRPLKRLLDTLDLPPGSVFVDLGSGKGKALLIASQYNFKRIVGIEFSSELCEIAGRNLSNYRKKVPLVRNVQIVVGDVADYTLKDDENVFFMFHPFDGVVMCQVLEAINLSLERNPRKIWLLYQHPVYRDLAQREGQLAMLGEFVLNGHTFAVFTNDSRNGGAGSSNSALGPGSEADILN